MELLESKKYFVKFNKSIKLSLLSLFIYDDDIYLFIYFYKIFVIIYFYVFIKCQLNAVDQIKIQLSNIILITYYLVL